MRSIHPLTFRWIGAQDHCCGLGVTAVEEMAVQCQERDDPGESDPLIAVHESVILDQRSARSGGGFAHGRLRHKVDQVLSAIDGGFQQASVPQTRGTTVLLNLFVVQRLYKFNGQEDHRSLRQFDETLAERRFGSTKGSKTLLDGGVPVFRLRGCRSCDDFHFGTVAQMQRLNRLSAQHDAILAFNLPHPCNHA
jgi:hypothetical protein